MKISEKDYNRMPAKLRALFVKLPNPGSDEVKELFPNDAQRFFMSCIQETEKTAPKRFLYTPKASRSERNAGLEGMEEQDIKGAVGMSKVTSSNWGNPDETIYERKTKAQNHHPTVKPLALMRYLVRLTKTPTGGVVLDPFMGSGTTGIACVLEGREFIGIEREEEYYAIAEKRIAHWSLQPTLQE